MITVEDDSEHNCSWINAGKFDWNFLIIDSVSSVNIFVCLILVSSAINVSVDVIRLTKTISYPVGSNGEYVDAYLCSLRTLFNS